MGKGEFKLNSKLKVETEGKEYSSNIQDVTEENILISIPVESNSYLTLREGEVVSVIYYGDIDLYQFDTVVVGRKKGNIPMIILQQPKILRKIQRRKFVRINNVNDIEYKRLQGEFKTRSLEEFYKDNRESFKKGTIIDISGGGCKIKTHEKLNKNDIVVLKFFIGKEYIYVICKVVRLDGTQYGTHVCGLAFIDLSENLREKIIKYIFDIMREQRKKGLKG